MFQEDPSASNRNVDTAPMPKLNKREIRGVIDPLCDAFDEAWAGGNRPAIVDSLRQSSEDYRAPLFRELLGIEIERRKRAGEVPDIDEYRAAWPDYHQVIEQTFQEVEAWSAARTSIQPDDRSLPVVDDTDQFVLETKPSGTASQAMSTEGLDNGMMPQQLGRYRVLNELGRGGMGTVLLVHDTVLDRRVALKLPDFAEENREEAVQRFYREARSMATVQHPGLCPIYDVGEHDGKPYLAMAFIDGPTLADVIASSEKLQQSAAAELLRNLSLAIHEAHSAGVVHRDLKPSNVILNRKQEPIITDFGLASRNRPMESDLTTTGAAIGSPAYMAPEQVEADLDRIGVRTDVYALGVILYELLTGRRPFDGKGLSVLGQITSGNPPPPVSASVSVNASLEAVCLKAMAFRPEDRFSSALELAAALVPFCQSHEDKGSARDHSADRPADRHVARRYILFTLASVAVCIAAFLALNSDRPENESESIDAEFAESTETTETKTVSGDISVGASTNTPAEIPLLAGWSPPKSVGLAVNSDLVDGSPTLTHAGRTLLFHRPSPDPPYYYVLWKSQRESPADAFGEPQRLHSGINKGVATNPHVAADGRTLVFDSDKVDTLGRLDIYVCERDSPMDSWPDRTNLGPTINTHWDERSPWISSDGLLLAFSSDRPGGHGMSDIWFASRPTREVPFDPPVNAGPYVNSSGNDGYPWLTDDGLTLVLSSHRAGSLGGFDLWVTTRRSIHDSFAPPVNLGPTINSSAHDSHAWISSDGSELYFESDRASPGNYDVYCSVRTDSKTVSAAQALPKAGISTRITDMRGWVRCFSFSRDGQRLLSVPRAQSTSISVWNLNAPLRSVLLSGHESPVRHAEFSPDDERIASCSSDGTPARRASMICIRSFPPKQVDRRCTGAVVATEG